MAMGNVSWDVWPKSHIPGRSRQPATAATGRPRRSPGWRLSRRTRRRGTPAGASGRRSAGYLDLTHRVRLTAMAGGVDADGQLHDSRAGVTCHWAAAAGLTAVLEVFRLCHSFSRRHHRWSHSRRRMSSLLSPHGDLCQPGNTGEWQRISGCRNRGTMRLLTSTQFLTP